MRAYPYAGGRVRACGDRKSERLFAVQRLHSGVHKTYTFQKSGLALERRAVYNGVNARG